MRTHRLCGLARQAAVDRVEALRRLRMSNKIAGEVGVPAPAVRRMLHPFDLSKLKALTSAEKVHHHHKRERPGGHIHVLARAYAAHWLKARTRQRRHTIALRQCCRCHTGWREHPP